MLVLHPGKTAGIFAFVIFGLLVGHAIGLILKFGFNQEFAWGLVPFFDFDREGNLPAFYSSIALMICAAFSALISLAHFQRHQSAWIGWSGLALVFAAVSLDESVSIHEQLIVPVRNMLELSGFFYFAWVIPYGIVVCVLTVCYGRFVFRLPAAVRALTILSAGVFLAGALGFELIGGYYFDWVDEKLDLPYALITTAEELLEMIGVLIFFYAELLYIRNELFGITIHICPGLSDRNQK